MLQINNRDQELHYQPSTRSNLLKQIKKERKKRKKRKKREKRKKNDKVKRGKEKIQKNL